jgi:hypothetical protein
MWTLILVTFVVSGAATGGVGTSTSFIDFPDEAKCRAAADAMAETNQVSLGKWERVPISLRRRSTASSPNALRADLSPKP